MYAVSYLMAIHYVYRMYDKGNRLLYIGSANNPGRRMAEHLAQAPFWRDVVNIGIEEYPNIDLALEAERLQIQNEEPVHNKIHNGRAIRKREQAENTGQSAAVAKKPTSKSKRGWAAEKEEIRARLVAEGVLKIERPVSR